MDYHNQSYKNYRDAWFGNNGMTFSLANQLDEEMKQKMLKKIKAKKREKEFRDSILKIDSFDFWSIVKKWIKLN